MASLLTTTVPSPIGTLRLVVDGDALCVLDFDDRPERLAVALRRQGRPAARTGTSAPLTSACRALSDYFDGAVRALDALPVVVRGTEFQERVWAALRTITPERPWSYAELAAAVGNAKAVRAVGTANGANPVALVIPCHRVVNTGGALGGYGGGLDRKRWLLDHEALHCGTRLAVS